MYSNNIDKANLTILLILISLLLAFIFAWVALKEHNLIEDIEEMLGGERELWKNILMNVLFWLTIIVIGVTFLAALSMLF